MCRRVFFVSLGLALAGLVLGFSTSAVITYVMPKKYESEAVIEVKPLPSAEGSSSQQMTPPFFATQFEVIRSRHNLEQVCHNLKLTERWMMDERAVVDQLKALVKTQNIRGTDLITIRVRHTNPVDARDIVAEVVKVYGETSMEREKMHLDEAMQELNRAVRDQEDKLEERRKLLVAIIKSKGRDIIINKSDSTSDPVEKSREGEIKRLLDAVDYNEAKRDFETEQELLQQLKLKKISQEIESKLPFSPVAIHDEPMIPQAPVSPNVTLNLVLGAVVGMILLPLAGLFVMGVTRLVRSPTKMSQ